MSLAASSTDAWLGSAGTTYALIMLAEFGDKSQLACMTLAARHRGLPVLLGAIVAFVLLNLLAVLCGGAIAAWLPAWAITAVVAAMFGYFGISALRQADEEEDESLPALSSHSVFATTFLMIFLAEFGDKTQLAVAGLGSAHPILPVWLGASLALATTSALGIFAGRRLLTRLPMHWIHRASGMFFLALAALAAGKLLLAV